MLVAVCEGKTEAALLEGLRKRWKIGRRSMHVEGAHGDPSNVVQVTLDKLQRGDRHIEAWAVFDRDEHHHWSSAIDRARAVGIRLAISNDDPHGNPSTSFGELVRSLRVRMQQ